MIAELKAHPFFAYKSIESCTLLEHQGYCNENYIVIADSRKYIVRKLLREDIDRALEWRVQGLAYELDITAEPLVFDEKQGFMVFAFLEGEHKTSVDKSDLKMLAQILHKLHSIAIDAKPIELHIENKIDRVLEAFKSIEKYPKEYVLCHNDLNPQNVFFKVGWAFLPTNEHNVNSVGKNAHPTKFIDWEYAGVNDRYFDLACVCVEFKLDEALQKVFLESYFIDEDYVLEKIEAYKVIYTVLCEEWFSTST